MIHPLPLPHGSLDTLFFSLRVVLIINCVWMVNKPDISNSLTALLGSGELQRLVFEGAIYG